MLDELFVTIQNPIINLKFAIALIACMNKWMGGEKKENG